MDEKWFKRQQRKAGVTALEIAEEMGRDRSAVSHILTGRRRMSLDWARAFAKVLDVSVDEVLARAGEIEEAPGPLRLGFSEGDASPFVPQEKTAKQLFPFNETPPGVDPWTLNSCAMQLDGFNTGDIVLIDSHQSDRCRSGDKVIAQVYDLSTGSAKTVFRRFEPPVLVAASPNMEDHGVFFVDGRNVVIKGKAVAMWRDCASTFRGR